MELKNIDDYFRTARERFLIKTRRDADWQKHAWTKDHIFQVWRFCNVFREDDKTTVWFRDNIRSQLSGQRVVNATVIFRWLNRIEVGEVIKDLLLAEQWDHKEAERRLTEHFAAGNPIVTGAYMIRTPEGMDKCEGVLWYIENALKEVPFITGIDLQEFWRQLLPIFGLGPFLAYEIVSDLRWTDVLGGARDINTWANAGPGCARGIGRVVTGYRKQFDRHKDQAQLLEIMQEIFECARQERFWPWQDRPWEMREVEHWACEYEKYCSARDGNRLKRRFL